MLLLDGLVIFLIRVGFCHTILELVLAFPREYSEITKKNIRSVEVRCIVEKTVKMTT